MSGDILLVEKREGLTTLILNRPTSLNALSTSSFERLDAALADIEAAGDSVGCVVLRGAGRGFCAGADIKASAAGEAPPPFNVKPRIFERLAALPVPVIAAVHGVCMGGGLELALACDLIVADTDARFADPHGRWGYVAAWGLTQRLPRRIGYPQAKRMMFTAREVDAREALAIGLVDVLAGGTGLDVALAPLVDAILANSRHTNRETKRILVATEDLPIAAGLAHESYHAPGPAPDTKARIAAFAAKTKNA